MRPGARARGDAARGDVVAFGQCAWDTMCLVPHVPSEDTKLEVARFVRRAGGPAATAAATVARLGGRAAFVGRFGDDAAGDASRAALEALGVDASHSIVVPGAASHEACVMVDARAGSRTIVWTRGSAGLLEPSDVPAALVAAARAILLDSLHVAAGRAAARIARRRGVRVFLDAGTARDGLRDVVRSTDVCFATRHCLRDLTGRAAVGEALVRLAALGPQIVGVTLGADGALAYDAARRTFVGSAGFAVDVVDTTGAGDAFHGAIAFALLRRVPLPRALAFANAVAALACTDLGAQSALPTAAAARALVRAQRRDVMPPAERT